MHSKMSFAELAAMFSSWMGVGVGGVGAGGWGGGVVEGGGGS